MTEITALPIEDIRRHPNARPLNDVALAALCDSIEQIGLISPIRVRRSGDGYQVIAGHHRFAACGLNGLREIDCIVVDDDDLHAEMAMIAENLHRAELTKLERDEQVARWIELSGQELEEDSVESFYAAVSENYSETSAGGGDAHSPQSSREPHASQAETHRKAGQQPGGVNAAARDLGISKPDAHRAVKVASLSDEAKTVAREIGLDDNRSALLDAARHATPEAQVKALQERKQGGIAGRVEEKPGPTYDDLRSAILLLADLKPEDFSRLCPPNKRAAMCQKLARLEQVFEQVREAVSA